VFLHLSVELRVRPRESQLSGARTIAHDRVRDVAALVFDEARLALVRYKFHFLVVTFLKLKNSKIFFLLSFCFLLFCFFFFFFFFFFFCVVFFFSSPFFQLVELLDDSTVSRAAWRALAADERGATLVCESSPYGDCVVDRAPLLACECGDAVASDVVAWVRRQYGVELAPALLPSIAAKSMGFACVVGTSEQLRQLVTTPGGDEGTWRWRMVVGAVSFADARLYTPPPQPLMSPPPVLGYAPIAAASPVVVSSSSAISAPHTPMAAMGASQLLQSHVAGTPSTPATTRLTITIIHDTTNCFVPPQVGGRDIDSALLYTHVVDAVLQTCELDAVRPRVVWRFVCNDTVSVDSDKVRPTATVLHGLVARGVTRVGSSPKKGAVDAVVRQLVDEYVYTFARLSESAQQREVFVLVTGDSDFAVDLQRVLDAGVPNVLLLHDVTNGSPALRAVAPRERGDWFQLVERSTVAVATNSAPTTPTTFVAASGRHSHQQQQQHQHQQQRASPSVNSPSVTSSKSATKAATPTYASKAGAASTAASATATAAVASQSSSSSSASSSSSSSSSSRPSKVANVSDNHEIDLSGVPALNENEPLAATTAERISLDAHKLFYIQRTNMRERWQAMAPAGIRIKVQAAGGRSNKVAGTVDVVAHGESDMRIAVVKTTALISAEIERIAATTLTLYGVDAAGAAGDASSAVGVACREAGVQVYDNAPMTIELLVPRSWDRARVVEHLGQCGVPVVDVRLRVQRVWRTQDECEGAYALLEKRSIASAPHLRWADVAAWQTASDARTSPSERVHFSFDTPARKVALLHLQPPAGDNADLRAQSAALVQQVQTLLGNLQFRQMSLDLAALLLKRSPSAGVAALAARDVLHHARDWLLKAVGVHADVAVSVNAAHHQLQFEGAPVAVGKACAAADTLLKSLNVRLLASREDQHEAALRELERWAKEVGNACVVSIDTDDETSVAPADWSDAMSGKQLLVVCRDADAAKLDQLVQRSACIVATEWRSLPNSLVSSTDSMSAATTSAAAAPAPQHRNGESKALLNGSAGSHDDGRPNGVVGGSQPTKTFFFRCHDTEMRDWLRLAENKETYEGLVQEIQAALDPVAAAQHATVTVAPWTDRRHPESILRVHGHAVVVGQSVPVISRIVDPFRQSLRRAEDVVAGERSVDDVRANSGGALLVPGDAGARLVGTQKQVDAALRFIRNEK
jgi:hypothetical protein